MGNRAEAKIPSSLWDDADFQRLDMTTQWLYVSLLTSRDLKDTGVLPLLPRRWARHATDATPDRLTASLKQLHECGLVYADFDQQEVFISGYYELERIALQPRRVIGVTDGLREIWSEPLAAFASAELTALLERAKPRPPRGVRAQILERDQWRCLACAWKPGDPVPMKNGRPLYRGLEIDHIHPKSKGGPDSPDNFQTLCTSCNASKGARV